MTTKKENSIIPTETNEREFNDLFDVFKHFTEVHNKRLALPHDYVLARPTPEEAKFISGQLLIGDIASEYIQDPEQATKIKDIIKNECDIKIILRRNDPNNWLMKEIIHALGSNPEETTQTEDQAKQGGILNRIKNALGKRNEKSR